MTKIQDVAKSSNLLGLTLCGLLEDIEKLKEGHAALLERIADLEADNVALRAHISTAGTTGAKEDDEPQPFPTKRSLLNSPHCQSGSIHRFLLGVDVEKDTLLLSPHGQGGTSLLAVYSKWADSLFLGPHMRLANIQAFGRAITKCGLFLRTKNANGMNLHLLPDWRERLDVYRQSIEEYDANKAKMFNKSAP